MSKLSEIWLDRVFQFLHIVSTFLNQFNCGLLLFLKLDRKQLIFIQQIFNYVGFISKINRKSFSLVT